MQANKGPKGYHDVGGNQAGGTPATSSVYGLTGARPPNSWTFQ